MVYIYIMENNQNKIKPGMNSESKAKFFAQYMFQRVLMWHDQSILYDVDGSDIAVVSTKKTQYFLLLTPLSDITDENAKELAKIGLPDQLYDYLWSSGTGKQIANSINHGRQTNTFYPNFRMGDAFDYLRSKGYALPWMGYSVEDMVQAGWIKLKGGK